MALDLGRFYQVSDPNDAGVGDFLTQLRQYDPNASYVATPQITNSDGTTNGTIYQLSFNPSKLPGVDGTGQLSQATSSAPGSAYSSSGGVNFFQGDAGGKIIDPSRTVHSPTYGDVNTFGNIKLPETHSWLDYAPLLVLAAGGAMGGFGVPGLLGGDAAAGGAGFDFGAGAAGTDAGNAIGLGGGPGFDFGAGAAGTDAGNAIGQGGSGFQWGMGDHGLGTTTGTEAATTGVLSPDEIAGLGPGNGFGMHDRGLGTTTGTEAATTGVLSPERDSGSVSVCSNQIARKLPDLIKPISSLLTPPAWSGRGWWIRRLAVVGTC
jgi:hypothetical protein